MLQTGLRVYGTCAAPALRRRRASGALIGRRGLAAAGLILDGVEHVALEQLWRGQRSLPALLAAATCSGMLTFSGNVLRWGSTCRPGDMNIPAELVGYSQLLPCAAPMTPGAQVSRRLPRRCSCACSSASGSAPSPITNFVRWSTCE
jgi:hypothetical protein